jgi:hypothetical protein
MLMNTKTTARKATARTSVTPPARTRVLRAVAPAKATTPAVLVTPGPATRGHRAKVGTQIAPPAPVEPVGHSKQARLIALLGSAPGTTIEQMTKLTGWQAHTVRGTISGVLRKRLGLNVSCADGDAGTRVYRIVGNAVSA